MDIYFDVATIGEALQGLKPAEDNATLELAPFYKSFLACSEANVVIGINRLGLKATWLSKMVDNPIGRTLVSTIKAFGVDTSYLKWVKNGRVGIMYLELGSYPRLNRVIYDRKNTTASQLQVSELDWGFIRRSRLIHLSGITTALSANCQEVVEKAIREANRMDRIVSYDLNYRSTLWESTLKARAVYQGLLTKYKINLLFIRLNEAGELFGLDGSPEEIIRRIKKEFNCCNVVLSLGGDGSLVLNNQQELYRGKVYNVVIENRLGVGDSFIAGFLYGYLTKGIEKALDYAAAMAALKLSIPNRNHPLITKEQVEQLIDNEKAKIVIGPGRPGKTTYLINR